MKIRIRNDAFSLLEVVIAMGLFAIGLMGVSLMSSGLMDSNRNARHRNEALQLARNCLETLRQGEYAVITDSIETGVDAGGNLGSGIFKREVVVEGKTGPACKEVTVTVSWWSGGEHRVVLKTIFSP
jgi:prepilin-type N-terminal cleavage/methylation domain-containing protein